MQCPRCHAENREGRRFCGECGLSFASACPSCRFLNEGSEKFCGGCGRSLTPSSMPAESRLGSPQSYTPKHLAEKILTSKAALEGERKQVTVLFADLKGSMELLADRDPEEARKILDPVLERMMEAVHRYEDHLAARIEQLAHPGSILLSPATLELAEGYIEIRPLGRVPVKGLQEPVEVYEVTGIGAARTRLQAAARRGLSRFVGRDAEMDQLRRTLQLAGDGHGQVVAIVGEPGVGKSRLFLEFIRSHRAHGWLVLESASLSYGQATAYLPVIGLLKDYFRIDPRDDTRTIREKVAGKLMILDRTLESILSPLLGLLDVPIDDIQWQSLEPPQRRQSTFESLSPSHLAGRDVPPGRSTSRGARLCVARAPTLAATQGTRQPRLRPSASRRDRLTSRSARQGGGRNQLRPGPGTRPGARHAAPRRPLPPRPRQALPPYGQARADPRAPDGRDGDVPRDGHALLARAGGGGDEGVHVGRSASSLGR